MPREVRLVDIPDLVRRGELALKCHCGEPASRHVACAAGHLVSRCASHGDRMEVERNRCTRCPSKPP